MREATDDVVVFTNDIASLDKELAAGDIHNTVICPPSAPRRHPGGRGRAHRGPRQRRHRWFEQTADRLPRLLAEAGAGTDRAGTWTTYVDGMREVMCGNLGWSLRTARDDERGIAAVSDGRRPWPDSAPRFRLTGSATYERPADGGPFGYQGACERTPSTCGRRGPPRPPPTSSQRPGLRVLILADNALTRLPPALGRLRRLHTLDLGHNRLAEIPEEIGELSELTRCLYLHDNRLPRLPRSLGRLDRLGYLNVGENPRSAACRRNSAAWPGWWNCALSTPN